MKVTHKAIRFLTLHEGELQQNSIFHPHFYIYVPGVKCHLFYILSTETPQRRTKSLVLLTHMAGFTGIFANSKRKRNKKKKNFFCAFFSKYISLSFYLKMLYIYITGPSLQLLTPLHLIDLVQKIEWGSP